ncbi:hypothetical protein QJU43_09850 [Pasteurella atlantica]|nr:hypothetical protein [Pasteurella atlantica]MDP8127614.1 hypothetical protein [Pasteurella atlantica]MDP8129544.1 hypothetical protein [Pasteurella atlantica]
MCYALFSAVSTVTENDKDGDGHPEKIVATVHNEDGTTTEKITYDPNTDGTPDKVIEKYRDAEGNLTKITTDEGADGVIEKTQLFLEEEFERSAIVKPNELEKTLSNPDEEGRPTEEIVKIIRPNGTVTTKTGTITYNDDGTQTIEYKVDKFSNGTIVTNTVETLDDQGRVIYRDSTNANGTHSVNEYKYEGNSNNAIEYIDISKNANGFETKKTIWTYEYDKEHPQVKKAYQDKNGDGSVEYVNDYNEGDNWSIHIYTKGDGTDPNVSPYWFTFTTYNDKGEVLQQTRGNWYDGVKDVTSHDQIDMALTGYKTTDIYEYNEFGMSGRKVLDRETGEFTLDSKCIYSDLGVKEFIGVDRSSKDKLDGFVDGGFVYDEFDLSSVDNLVGMQALTLYEGGKAIISDETLDKIANPENGNHLLVAKAGKYVELVLDGFTDTGRTDANNNVYADAAGNEIMVFPDITVTMI